MINKWIVKLREIFGVEEAFFSLGMALLYCGLLSQFGQAIAQIVTGSVFVFISILIAFKGAA
jgi:hypothetical protein